MINWELVYCTLYGWYSPYTREVVIGAMCWDMQIPDAAKHLAKSMDNLGRCIGAAAAEYARLRYTTWVLFGWPLNGR